MSDQTESYSLLNDYVGIDKRTTVIFLSLIIGIFIVVTCIYVAIFGLQNWTSNMKRAGSMMIANFDAPLSVPQAIPSVPGAVAAQPAATVAAAQFHCATCGLSGLPLWNQNGTPLCPTCGAVMMVRGLGGM